MKIKHLLFAFIIGFTTNTMAQINAITEDGKAVTLEDDATWHDPTIPLDASLKSVDDLKQGCSEYVTTRLDERTGLNYKTIRPIMLISEDDESQWIIIDIVTSTIPNLKDVLIFTFSPFGAGDCIKDENKIIFQFEDGETLTLENDGMYNCDNKFMLYFGGSFEKKEELMKIGSIELGNIKIETQDGSVHKVFTDEQRTSFQKSIQCLMDAIK